MAVILHGLASFSLIKCVTHIYIYIHFVSVLHQGGACKLNGKQDKQDFTLLVDCFETIGLDANQVSTIWAILSSILQLGNICFSSYEVCVYVYVSVSQITFGVVSYIKVLFQRESFEVSHIFCDAETRRVGSLLQISSEALQTIITHRVTVSRASCTSPAFSGLIVHVSVNVHTDQYCNLQETTYEKIYCPLSVERAIESR